MRVVDLLRLVRDGDSVPEDALRVFVQGISQGTVPDYQATAFLMAVFHRGLNDASTAALTLAMRDSGQRIDLSDVPGIKVDKHSTGGVGDKISVPLAPWVAACGVPVPMVSGRGLGHTGGTLDKLESIPGFRVDLDLPRFRRTVRELGLCLIGQTADLAPADKKLYALRDVTATVESIPLITASILAKKLAEGIDALVLDVKVGRGAFMKDLDSARRLAQSLVRVGTAAGVAVRALLTRMDAPLGRTIGNALEVRESIDILHGRGPEDTTELTLALGAEMLVLGRVAVDAAEARQKLLAVRDSGAAAAKLEAIIAAQDGDPRVVAHPERLPQASHRTVVRAERSGTILEMDAFELGMTAMRLGAGRSRAEDRVDPAVGIELCETVGATVAAGTPLALVHHNAPLAAEVAAAVRQAIRIGEGQPAARPLVLETLG
jgi:pyrimidine-nucleoside phosphorylase